MSSLTMNIQCYNTNLYWSPIVAYLSYNNTGTGTETLMAMGSEVSFTMNTIDGGNGQSVYFTSAVTTRYLQWNNNGKPSNTTSNTTSNTASITNSLTYYSDTQWDNIPHSDQKFLTFYFTSVPLITNGFRLQIQDKNGKFLKLFNYGGVNYILAFDKSDDFGIFTKQPTEQLSL